jgi:hypothetical protein
LLPPIASISSDHNLFACGSKFARQENWLARELVQSSFH